MHKDDLENGLGRRIGLELIYESIIRSREKKRGGGGRKGRETCNGLSVTSSLIGSTCLKLPTSNYRRTRDTRRTVPFIVLKSTHNGINSLSLIAVSRHPSSPPPSSLRRATEVCMYTYIRRLLRNRHLYFFVPGKANNSEDVD